MKSPATPQKNPYNIRVEKGKTYFWCACGLSQKQPFCDGAHKKEGKFTEKDLDLLDTITSQATIALQRHLVQEQMENSRKKEREFMDVVSQMSSELELSSLMPKILHHITTLLDAERSTLWINDIKTNELFTMVAEGTHGREIRMPNHMGIAGHVFTTGEVLNIPHAYADLRFNPDFDKKT